MLRVFRQVLVKVLALGFSEVKMTNNQDYGSAIASLLGNLLNPNNTPIAAGARALGAASGTPVGQNPLPAMGQAAMQIGPYQKGVEKALKEGGYAHASEALQQGVSADHIQQQAGLVQPQQMQQTQETSVQPQQPKVDPNILQQLLGGLVSGGKVNDQGVYQSIQLLGGLLREPADQQLQRQQAYSMSPAGEVQKAKMAAEQVPMTIYEKAQVGATGYKNQADVLNNQLAKIDESEKSLQAQMELYEKTRGPMNKATGGPSKEMKATQKQIDSLRKTKAMLHSRLAALYGQQPNFSPSGNVPQGATHYSPSTKKYYDAQGNVVK